MYRSNLKDDSGNDSKDDSDGDSANDSDNDSNDSDNNSNDFDNDSNDSDNDSDNDLCMKHLTLLIDHIKTTYTSTKHSLVSLLKGNEITYDLLWALFKPNSLVYTTCFGTSKPRCVKYDSAEEKASITGTKYYSLGCRYLDFNGEVFGEVSIELKIMKFRGTKRINTLEAFPLQYHRSSNSIKADLVQCGRKFVSLIGSHHRQYYGSAFYMKKDEAIQVPVNSRIMVDANFFRKMNPNYSVSRVTEPAVLSATEDGWILFDDAPSKPPLDQVKSNGIEPAKMKEDELLTCSPTVPGFSFGNKLWRKTISLAV